MEQFEQQQHLHAMKQLLHVVTFINDCFLDEAHHLPVTIIHSYGYCRREDIKAFLHYLSWIRMVRLQEAMKHLQMEQIYNRNQDECAPIKIPDYKFFNASRTQHKLRPQRTLL